MALAKATVDIPVGSLSQTPPEHGGPTGRMQYIYDAVITHYSDATANTPKRVLLDPRNGFASFSNVLRNYQTGAVETGTWATPQLLAPLGDQLVSVCSSKPRVFTGSDWTNYGDKRVVTSKLSESVLHTSNSAIAAPTHAWLTGVTCSVWTEQVPKGGSFLTTTYVGFKGDDGTWVRVPTVLYTSNDSNIITRARVVQDGAYFWVFYNWFSSGDYVHVGVHNAHGEQLAELNISQYAVSTPGYWDVSGSNQTGVQFVQPATPGTDGGIETTLLSFDGVDTITPTVVTDASVHCVGPVKYLRNDLNNHLTYIATLGLGEGPGGRLWAYELSPVTGLATHTYDTTVLPPTQPDSVTGWTETLGNVKVTLAYSLLAAQQTIGPTYDPACRSIKTISVARNGTTELDLRKTTGVILQSEAFPIDGEYHAFTYYQSGSGQDLPSEAESVSWTAGDYLLGPRLQPLAITSGGTYGAPRDAHLSAIFTGASALTWSITNTDKVESILSSGIAGITDGTPILKWTFANSTAGLGHGGYILKLVGSSIASANFSWDIIAEGSLVLYTPTTNRAGGTVVPGTFTATGTGEYIRTARYIVGELGTLIPSDVMDLFAPGGTMTVTGASAPGNNGTFTLINRDPLCSALDNAAGYPVPSSLWTLLTTQAVDTAFAGSLVIGPAQPDVWFELGDTLTAADNGGTLFVADNPVTSNNGLELPIVGIPSSSQILTDATSDAATVAQIFATPLPSLTLGLPGTSSPYKLHLQSVTFDYSYNGALVSIADAQHTSNDGVYRITTVLDDGHTVIVSPTNGMSNQRNETFANTISIFIQRSANVQQQTQPTWFITPLTGTQPQVGCFEKGLAYADWRFDGEPGPGELDPSLQNRYSWCLSATSFPFDTNRQVVLPYRAISFVQATIATVGATSLNIANLAEASTVGLKTFQLGTPGTAQGASEQLLIPGPLATEFTSSGFTESNFNVAPEAPFIVSEGTDSGTTFGLTPKATYIVQVVADVTDENGKRVLSIPSPPLTVPLTGTSNYAVYGGRTINPLGTDGQPMTGVFGLSNRYKVVYSIYRNVIVDGTPSTELHLITQLNNPNGLYVSGSMSGFSFPDEYTWNYRDQNPDAAVRATEVVYSGSLGQGVAPHWPAPPHSTSAVWSRRRWVVGYDGAVWCSAEFVEGEAEWFFPGLRYPFPEDDPAVAVVGFENYLFMFCRKSVWRIGLAELPNATLTAGSLPTPVQVPLAAGCTGHAVAMLDFVAYTSSAGDGTQVWAITRNLTNAYLSEDIEDNLTQPITALAVDGKQRLLMTTGGTTMHVYDPIPKEWYTWRMPSAVACLTSYEGQPTYQDSGFVLQQGDANIQDTRNAVATNVAIDATYSNLSFTSVRAVKRLWECQIIGKRNGACNINAVIGYPDDDPATTTTFGPTFIDPNAPLCYAINPDIEEATSWTVRVFGSWEGINVPGRCFSLEMLSCEVGVDAKQGVSKLPNSFRMTGR